MPAEKALPESEVRPGGGWPAGRRGLAAACLALAGCGSTGGGAGGVLDAALDTVGLQRAQSPQPSRVPWIPGMPSAEGGGQTAAGKRTQAPGKAVLRLHAGEVLNTDPHGRSLSVVVRIYKLRDKTAFESAPYADFQQAGPGAPPGFAADAAEVREVVLTPGKRFDVIETITPDAPYLAVVALFRAPAQGRWRHVFEGDAAARTGVTMGVHGCALSVSVGRALDAAPEMARIAGVRCGE